MMKSHSAVAALSALSHESRLAAFRQITRAGPGGLSVAELRKRLDIPPATLTAHLNVLRAAALVHDQREGRVIRLRANFLQMDALLAYLAENRCAGAEACVAVPAHEPGRRARRPGKRVRAAQEACPFRLPGDGKP